MTSATDQERTKATEEAISDLQKGESMLNFSGRRLGDAFCSAIGEAALGSDSLRWLQLDRNMLSTTSAEGLCGLLKKPGAVLQSLDLDFNRIGDSGASAIGLALQANCSLRELTIANNGIGVAGAQRLAEALSSDFVVLKTLSLHGNNIADAGAEAIGASLAKNQCLCILSLYSNRIGDTGAVALAAGLSKGNSTLRELAIGDNAIGVVGAKAIGKMLTLNSTLQELGLSRNCVGDEGCQSLAEGIRNNGSLKELWVLDNKVSKTGLGYFVDPLEENESLERLGITVDPDSNAEDGAKEELEESLKGLKRTHALRRCVKEIEMGSSHVSVDAPDLGDKGVKRIAQSMSVSSTLRDVELNHCSISDEGAFALAETLTKNKSISRISLANNEIGDFGAKRLVAALERNNTVERLDLEGNPINDDVADDLCTPRVSTRNSTPRLGQQHSIQSEDNQSDAGFSAAGRLDLSGLDRTLGQDDSDIARGVSGRSSGSDTRLGGHRSFAPPSRRHGVDNAASSFERGTTMDSEHSEGSEFDVGNCNEGSPQLVESRVHFGTRRNASASKLGVVEEVDARHALPSLAEDAAYDADALRAEGFVEEGEAEIDVDRLGAAVDLATFQAESYVEAETV